jgi:hypothetical protein
MLFTLEAVQALHGDALLLHFGKPSAPELMVIDGGPSTVYDNHLQPRLLELKKARAGEKAPLPIRAMMISHIDDDHINGLLSLLRDLDQHRKRGPLPFRIDDFWFNSFDDLVGKEAETVAVPSKGARTGGGGVTTAAVGAPVPPDADLGHTAGLVLASVTQGREVRNLVKKLGIPANNAFGKKLIMLSAQPKPKIAPLTITVVAPSKARRDELHVKWDKELVNKGLAKTAAYVDKSVANLSSIVMLVEAGKKSMLLTGDARGDDVLAGLRAVGKIKGKKPLKLDILKLPHHGSIRDTDTDFFELLPAAHYVVSANGKYENPDLATMQMLSKVRTDDTFTIHLTNHTPWLDKFFASEKKKKKRKYRVSYPEDTSGRTVVNLGDHLED